MIHNLLHDLKIDPSRDEKARQEFVSCLRGYILVDMATAMSERFEQKVAPLFEQQNGRAPTDGSEVHRAMKDDLCFKFYSSIRYNAQEMVWRSVIPVVERNLNILATHSRELIDDTGTIGGSLKLDHTLQIPRNVKAVDVHLAPGSYHTEYIEDDVAAGAIYDNGLNIFAANMMGSNLDDIGESMSNFIKLQYPSFNPQSILDCGCTVGHNSVAWAKTYPDATTHAIDVCAPILRYGAARAQSQRVAVNFAQMNATTLEFEDASMDVVFTSMFLHELPPKDIRAFMAEAFRVLKSGGLLLNMELPPNDQMTAYDSFYLDWDCYYNQEPYSKCFRDQNYQSLCTDAGFQEEDCVQFIMPQYGYMKSEDFANAIGSDDAIDDKVGRLTTGINWFAFGAWKS
jgi:ubiquinone/menaquinone biosynthesis C-methylase UbiE